MAVKKYLFTLFILKRLSVLLWMKLVVVNKFFHTEKGKITFLELLENVMKSEFFFKEKTYYCCALFVCSLVAGCACDLVLFRKMGEG
jgi:hypothetical protein